MEGRDIKDWSVAFRYDHSDREKRKKYHMLCKLDQGVDIVGPSRSKEDTSA